MSSKLTYQSLRCQEEQIRLRLLKVHSDRFCWIREEQAATLVAQLEMGDFQAVKRVCLALVFHQSRFQGVDFSYSITVIVKWRPREVGKKTNNPPCESVASPDILNELIILFLKEQCHKDIALLGHSCAKIITLGL